MNRFALLAVIALSAMLLTACAEKKEMGPAPGAMADAPQPVDGSYQPLERIDTSSVPPPRPLPAASTETAPPPAPMQPVYTPPPSNMRAMDEPLTPSRSTRGAGGGRTYVVKKGDTLSEISQKMYGDSTRWRRIWDANRGRVKDPKRLQVGTRLIIP
ncbi:MAG: LysM peptidoglycan-binding domain-containing protein [Phycisphaerae bacterium]